MCIFGAGKYLSHFLSHEGKNRKLKSKRGCIQWLSECMCSTRNDCTVKFQTIPFIGSFIPKISYVYSHGKFYPRDHTLCSSHLREEILWLKKQNLSILVITEILPSKLNPAG